MKGCSARNAETPPAPGFHPGPAAFRLSGFVAYAIPSAKPSALRVVWAGTSVVWKWVPFGAG